MESSGSIHYIFSSQHLQSLSPTSHGCLQLNSGTQHLLPYSLHQVSQLHHPPDTHLGVSLHVHDPSCLESHYQMLTQLVSSSPSLSVGQQITSTVFQIGMLASWLLPVWAFYQAR